MIWLKWNKNQTFQLKYQKSIKMLHFFLMRTICVHVYNIVKEMY